MSDEQYTFTQARNRLEDIVLQVRKKDVSLEHSLDLLEEGVKLASVCTELIDHTEWRAVADELAAEESGQAGSRLDEAPTALADTESADSPTGEPTDTGEATDGP
jgi:exodeoxyribonuclease VII small subunit